MKKKTIILICVFTCVALLSALLGGVYWYRSTYIQIGEETFRRDIPELTLSGGLLPETSHLQQLHNLTKLDLRDMELTVAEYEALKDALPGCRILWNVPFQGAYLSEDTTELTVNSLSSADFESITHLPSLKTLCAENCRDYDALMALKELYPALDIRYCVVVNGTAYPAHTESLTVPDASADEIRTALAYLPALKQIAFTGTAPDNETIYQMMCDYPQVDFLWDLNVFGIETNSHATELILSGIPMESTEEIETYLKYFPSLQRVEMCDCGISSADMDALSKRWPDIRFVWTINIGFGKVRTDITSFMPMHLGYTKMFPFYDEDCADLKYCTDLVCLDLGHMRIHDLSFLANMPKLKYLIIADIPCQDYAPLANLKDLIYLEVFFNKFPNQEILLELKNLQDLNISYTPIEDINVLKQMTWLKRLWASGSGITTPQRDELIAALPDTKIETNLPHATAGGWRNHKNYFQMRDLLGAGYMVE